MLSVAIVTKFLPATDHRGARIVASVPARLAEDGITRSDYRAVVSYPYHLNTNDAHELAARVLLSRLGWDKRTIVGGATADGCVFVFTDD